MNVLYANYITEGNISRFFLSQHIEYSVLGKEVCFYNTLFDSLLLASMSDEHKAVEFVSTLEKGCDDIIELISRCFDKDAQSIYTLLVQKKIIE